MAEPQLDFEKTQKFLGHVFGFAGGMITAGMIHLGDKLGLYKTMWKAGPLTAAQLAEKTGLNERWLLEWLRQQAASELLDYKGNDTFELSAEQAAVLADEEGSVFFGAGAFAGMPDMVTKLRNLPESFRTGLGMPYDAGGEGESATVERMFAPWYRHMLVPLVLPAVPGLVDRLTEGATAADIGCGAGVAVLQMAKAFPNSQFHGYDISKHALARAAANKAAAGTENVHFHDVSADALPDEAAFDFITAFDCIHDMTNPAGALGAARKALKPDGVLLVADIKGHATFEENVENLPNPGMMYGFSVASCMSSALSEPGGAGLGTLGFHPQVATRMLSEAGFSSVEPRDLGHPINMYYEARP